MDFSRGRIGVNVREVPPGEAKEQGARVAVENVTAGSPAEQAGVRTGDLILEFDGERVRSTRQFARLVDETPEGYAARLTLSRGGQRVTLEVTPERQSAFRVMPLERWGTHRPEGALPPPGFREFDIELPDIEVFTSRRSSMGVQVQSLTDQLAAHLGVKHGVLVTSVESDSPGARAGLKAGDVITAVDGKTVEDPRDLRRWLQRIDDTREFTVDVTRGKQTMTLKGVRTKGSAERF
jgi:serine protease Do